MTPAIYSTVKRPVTISWTTRDFVPDRDGTFAVFVDRSPMPPGSGRDYFRPTDTDGIFYTDRETLRLDNINTVASSSSAERNYHQVTVVLLDMSGHRIGEEAGFTAFTLAPL